MRAPICTVGPVQKDRPGSSQYSFPILDSRVVPPRPIVTLVYARRFEAINAHFILEQALLNIADIR
jgi:hypothetical protein